MKPGDYVQITVTDTGIGMDEATRTRMFEPFFTTKAPGKGTGLGLSTVYGFVRQCGGYIGVMSTPGQGTSIELLLPRAQHGGRAPPTPAVLRRRTGAAARMETVLLAEDEEGVRQLAIESLERRGYRVLAAASGEEALKLAGAYDGTIHLLLSDVVMPGMKGPELADRMRAHAAGHPGAADVRLRRRRRDARTISRKRCCCRSRSPRRRWSRPSAPASTSRFPRRPLRRDNIRLRPSGLRRDRLVDDQGDSMTRVLTALALAGRVALPAAALAQTGKPSLMNPASLNEQAPATYKVKFDTSAGEFVITVTRAWAPLGADRFYNLVKNGFYDGARFFRVVPNFMVQCGINGDPDIQRNWANANIKDDPAGKKSNDARLHHVRQPRPRTRARRRCSSTTSRTRSSTRRSCRSAR